LRPERHGKPKQRYDGKINKKTGASK